MVKDRNWRFRRYPLDMPIHKLVEHHIAKNKDLHSPPLGDPRRIHPGISKNKTARLAEDNHNESVDTRLSGARRDWRNRAAGRANQQAIRTRSRVRARGQMPQALPRATKQIQIKLLGFAWFYSSESG